MDLSSMTSANPDETQKLWDEVAAERGAEMPTAAKPPAPAAHEETVVASSQQQEAQKQPGDAGQSAQDPQAATAPASAGGASVTEPPSSDQLKELVEKIGRLEGQLRNVNGHIGGLSTGQQQLREMLSSASKAATAAGADAPTQAQVAEAMKSPEEWDRLREDFPEFATATEKMLEAKLAGLQTQAPAPAFDQAALDKMIEERVAKEAAAVRTEVVNSHLDSIVDGNWRTEVATEKFGKWLDAQPADVKSLADSSSMADAAKMLRLYHKDSTSNSTQQIVEQRQARLGNSVTPRNGVRAQKAKAPEDMTPQELWNYEAAQRERRRASA